MPSWKCLLELRNEGRKIVPGAKMAREPTSSAASVTDRLAQLTMRDGMFNGEVQVSGGSPADVARFFGYFEVPLSTPIRLVVR